MNNSKIITLAVAGLMSLLLSLTSDASVRSITVEIDATDNNDVQIGKKVIVTCRSGRGKHEILKKDGASEWCDTAIGDVCSRKKNSVAQSVCTSDYRKKVAAQQSADNQEIIKLKQELIEIEQKRLEIADQVLKLKRRELQLQTDS